MARVRKSNEQKAAEYLRSLGMDLTSVGVHDDSMLVSREINEQKQRAINGVQMMLNKPKSLIAKKCLYCAQEFLTNYQFEGCCSVEHSIALYEKRYGLKWNLKKRMWEDYEPPVSIGPEELKQLEEWATHFLADLENLRQNSQRRLPILLEEIAIEDENGLVPFVSFADEETPSQHQESAESLPSPDRTEDYPSQANPPVLLLDLELDL